MMLGGDTGGAMVEWPTKKLGELTDICRGSSPRPICDTKYFEGGTVPWVKIADATKSGKFLYETKEHVNDYGASFSRRLPPGTILVAASGTLGYTQILGVEGCAHDGWLIIQNLRDLDRDFAYYALKTLEQHFFNSGSGAAIQNINTDILRQAEIPHPPLPVQKRIAGILSAYDELIENSKRRIRILEAMARALYREWFVHFRFPGHDNSAGEPNSTAAGRPEGVSAKDGTNQNHPRVASPLDDIPQGWEVRNLGDVCRVIPGYAFKSKDWQSDGVPVIKIKNIQQDNSIDVQDTDFVSENVFQNTNEKFVLEFGDILLAMTGATAGKLGKLRSKDRFLLNQRVAKIQPDKAFKSFVWCAISTEESKERFFRLADGAAQPNMSGSQIEGVELICPPKNVAAAFSKLTDPILNQADMNYQKIHNLCITRDLLLPRLMSGQIEVEEN
jgi:type I restriction enzyme S subunit